MNGREPGDADGGLCSAGTLVSSCLLVNRTDVFSPLRVFCPVVPCRVGQRAEKRITATLGAQARCGNHCTDHKNTAWTDTKHTLAFYNMHLDDVVNGVKAQEYRQRRQLR